MAVFMDSRNNITIIQLPEGESEAIFAGLAAERTLTFAATPMACQRGTLLLLPHTPRPQADLLWLRQQGWDEFIKAHLKQGGKLLALGGGYQMLGRAIADPHHIEAGVDSVQGLGLLNFASELRPELSSRAVTAYLSYNDAPLQASGLYSGLSQGLARNYPACYLNQQPEGVLSDDRQILGSYLRGLFDYEESVVSLLAWVEGRW